LPEPDPPGADDDLQLLRDVAREAGPIALRYFRKDPEVWLKEGASPVSEADYAVDAFLRETLLDARPTYGWLSEETVDTAERLSARRTFVVDPIDGTRGFLQGLDAWCISLAVVERGRPLAGVLECPARGQTYWAAPGSGAHRDGNLIRVRQPPPRPDVGGPRPMINALADTLTEPPGRFPHVPSLAVRIALIADGALDATFVKPNAHDWDLAAADLILAEAGGSIVNDRGERPAYGGATVKHGALAAGSGTLLAAMVPILGMAQAEGKARHPVPSGGERL
jgi:myo-inositol-1(or 4)-monophosphatase